MQIYNPVVNGRSQNSHVTIGGKTYRGNSIQVLNGEVIIDGKVVDRVNGGININNNVVNCNGASVSVAGASASGGNAYASAGGVPVSSNSNGVAVANTYVLPGSAGAFAGEIASNLALDAGLEFNSRTASQEQLNVKIEQVVRDIKSSINSTINGNFLDDYLDKNTDYHFREMTRLGIEMAFLRSPSQDCINNYNRHVLFVNNAYNGAMLQYLDSAKKQLSDAKTELDMIKKGKKKEKSKKSKPEPNPRNPEDLEGRLIDLLE